MRVLRTFAFIDLCGFTAFADRYGDVQSVLVLADLRASLREIAARRGVRIVKWLGDGAMLSAAETSAIVGLTMETSHRMETAYPALPVRAGIARGPVVMFEGDDYIGEAVNVAARLCGLANPYECLATADVVEQVPPWVIASAAKDVDVRGLARPVASCALRIAGGSDLVMDPVCGLLVRRIDAVTVGPHALCSEACRSTWHDAGLPAVAT